MKTNKPVKPKRPSRKPSRKHKFGWVVVWHEDGTGMFENNVRKTYSLDRAMREAKAILNEGVYRVVVREDDAP